MSAINGLCRTVRAAANVRINKFTPLVKDTTDTTQNQEYAGVPAAANAAGFIGITVDHFVEPSFFVPEGTDPTTITGTTPVLYTLTGKGVTVQVDAVARGYAASAIAQGDWLNIADSSGRLKKATETAGTQECIGMALNKANNANDIVTFRINPVLR
jgi:hypothetical protein